MFDVAEGWCMHLSMPLIGGWVVCVCVCVCMCVYVCVYLCVCVAVGEGVCEHRLLIWC